MFYIDKICLRVLYNQCSVWYSETVPAYIVLDKRGVYIINVLISPLKHMGLRLRKGTLEHMQTAKIKTSLPSHAVWSGYLQFSWTSYVPYRRYRTNCDLDPTRDCAKWSVASLFVYALRAFLSAGGPYDVVFSLAATLRGASDWCCNICLDIEIRKKNSTKDFQAELQLQKIA